MHTKMKYRPSLFLAICTTIVLNSCSVWNTSKVPTLSLLDVKTIPYETSFQQTKIGGLSGIDYDAKNDRYLMISDDRSEKNNARIYEAKIKIKDQKIDTITFEKVIFMKNKNQEFFQNYRKNQLDSVDPEDVRYNPNNNQLYWTSEGDRITNTTPPILVDPSIFVTKENGDYISEFQIPENLKMSATETGPRRNGVLEGLSFNIDFTKIYTNVEEPIFQDGETSTLQKGGIIRFYEFDINSQKNTQQFFYVLDPVAKAPIPSTAFAVNGVSGFINYKKDKLLVLERSYSTGTAACTIKIFDFDIKKATIATENAPKNIQNSKKLVLNLDTLGIFIDNVEGISLGPKLPNGKQTLLLISDNNFSDKQKNQIFLFQIN
mgnify:CR=1 FL=1